jgi:hypothetical protein
MREGCPVNHIDFICFSELKIAKPTVSPTALSGDILDPDSDDITATKFAVDCQIEHGQVASATLD